MNGETERQQQRERQSHSTYGNIMGNPMVYKIRIPMSHSDGSWLNEDN